VHLLVSEQYIDSIMHDATIKVIFPFLFFYGCEVQGVASTKCMATEKWVCILLLISSWFSYRSYLWDRKSFWLYSSVLMLMEEL